MKTSQLLAPVFGEDDDPEESNLTVLEIVQNSIDARRGSDRRLGVDPWPLYSPEVSGNVVELPRFERLEVRPTEFFAAIQEWEGTITAVGEESFTADLYDVRGAKDEVSEIAEISFGDIDPADRRKVREGAIFRWLIGHSRTRSDQFFRKWVIYFRRAPEREMGGSGLETLRIPEGLKYVRPVSGSEAAGPPNTDI